MKRTIWTGERNVRGTSGYRKPGKRRVPRCKQCGARGPCARACPGLRAAERDAMPLVRRTPRGGGWAKLRDWPVATAWLHRGGVRAEEDNHENGIARKLFLIADPELREKHKLCACKADEVQHVEPDGYRWSEVPGSDFAETMALMGDPRVCTWHGLPPCPKCGGDHGAPDCDPALDASLRAKLQEVPA